ncbi:hypothetical protein IFO70_16190 [Phormidium tenue FACHB-886]|nr:hypothetical protein [Phormidium tenue FACHB-886]
MPAWLFLAGEFETNGERVCLSTSPPQTATAGDRLWIQDLRKGTTTIDLTIFV